MKIGKYKLENVNKLDLTYLNRDTDRRQVEVFKVKFIKNGICDPIKVCADYGVLEGHHRVIAFKELYPNSDIPVYILTWYKNLSDEEKLQVIISLNSKNLSWKPKDYLKSWSKIKGHYKYVLDKFKNNNSFTVNNYITLYFEKQRGMSDKFKEGNAEFINKNHSDHLLKGLTQLRDNYGSKVVNGNVVNRIIPACNSNPKKDKTDFIIDKINSDLENDTDYYLNTDRTEKRLKYIAEKYKEMYNEN
tara:strand:- start:2451 stop:3188 length:738 start_codon:yes stop_codon:yes gene_type:complete